MRSSLETNNQRARLDASEGAERTIVPEDGNVLVKRTHSSDSRLRVLREVGSRGKVGFGGQGQARKRDSEGKCACVVPHVSNTGGAPGPDSLSQDTIQVDR